MEFCCYVGVVSPTTPVRTACVLPICKAGSYFRLRSLLLSVCSFVLAPDRTEPPLWECVPDLFASRLSISNFVCRYVKKYISTSPGAPAWLWRARSPQLHSCRCRSCQRDRRAGAFRACCLLSPAVLAVWVAVETSAAEGWVRPGVFFGESAAGKGHRAFAGGTCTTRCLQRG